MKRYISTILTGLLLLTCVLTASPKVYASTKPENSRTIAIVFDNSGSMYDDGDQAWCRATYAMEVFASMLNAGDILQIYPMHPITVGGQEYTMNDPFQIADAAQASMIREIYTKDAGGTPIESIDCAVNGLQAISTGKKYMIVLTDGGTFSKKGSGLTKARTKSELDKRIQAQAGPAMTVMYLGIGSSACMPDTKPSEYFVKKQAVNTEDVLSTLTEMCNLIFGRDTLPKSRIVGNSMEFDISMSKLIVFVQGENISNLKITGVSGGTAGQLISTQQTKYATDGCGDYKSVPDTSLQGMMVTYADCAAGRYTIDYTGTATSVEVYYEPDADLDFVFTDADGTTVDRNALYDGNYKVSFGMKDAKTGKLIASDLLGNPHYQGSYSINGQATSFTHDGYSGEVPIALKMDDTFNARLTVTYLSGYTITKDSSDFGWPDGGIRVTARPAGELKLEISGGDSRYPLQDLEKGRPYIAKVYYNGVQLVGDTLKSVELKWDPDTSNAEVKQEFAEDHYNLSLHYKDPNAPQNTVCGECTVDIHAFYTEYASEEAQTKSQLSYHIADDFAPLEAELFVPEDYIVIDQIEESQAIRVTLKKNGVLLIPEEFAATKLQVTCGGIEYEIEPQGNESAYLIRLHKTAGLAEGDYPIEISAQYTDRVGRTTQAADSQAITLSNMPLWLKWLIGILIFLIIFLIIWFVMHIRVLPKYLHTSKKLGTMVFAGDPVGHAANFTAEIKKKQLTVKSSFGGRTCGLTMDVKPGKESYLYKPSKRRSAEVKPATVRKFGPAKIQDVTIGSVKYTYDEETGKLGPAIPNQKPFVLTNGMMVKYSGTMSDAGVDKDLEVTSKLAFTKK